MAAVAILDFAHIAITLPRIVHVLTCMCCMCMSSRLLFLTSVRHFGMVAARRILDLFLAQI